ncbi:hypothetical protein EON65_03480 [archaeon]|nr:MAG: hypothetical protein EON65_03480 [archaeon]
MPPKKKPVKADSDEESNGESENEMEDQESNDGGSESGDSESGAGSDSDNDSDGSNNDSGSDDGQEEEDEEDVPILKGKGKRAAPASKKAPPTKKVKATPARSKKVDKKKTKSKTKSKSKPKSSSKAEESSSEPKLHKLKASKKSERLEEARKAYKWWEAPKLEPGINWHFLEHPGVKFAPPYERHNIPLYHNGRPLALSAEQEEVATFFAAMPLDGPQLGNPKTKPVFERNFLEDFQEVLGTDHQVASVDQLDFSEIRVHLDMQKSLRKAATDEEKAVKKTVKEQDFLQFGYAMIDGRVEKVSMSVSVCTIANTYTYT